MFHKEGYQIIMTSFVLTAGIAVLSEYSIEDHTFIKSGVQIIALLMLILILQLSFQNLTYIFCKVLYLKLRFIRQ